MSDKPGVKPLAVPGDRNYKRGVRDGTVHGRLSRQEIYAEDDTLWLKAQEQVLAKVWENNEDAEYDD